MNEMPTVAAPPAPPARIPITRPEAVETALGHARARGGSGNLGARRARQDRLAWERNRARSTLSDHEPTPPAVEAE